MASVFYDLLKKTSACWIYIHIVLHFLLIFFIVLFSLKSLIHWKAVYVYDVRRGPAFINVYDVGLTLCRRKKKYSCPPTPPVSYTEWVYPCDIFGSQASFSKLHLWGERQHPLSQQPTRNQHEHWFPAQVNLFCLTCSCQQGKERV